MYFLNKHIKIYTCIKLTNNNIINQMNQKIKLLFDYHFFIHHKKLIILFYSSNIIDRYRYITYQYLFR